jgi:GT2 family glycosyltransferase
VYLVDDGSTDGTSAAVRASFPEVKIIAGTGSLYWCGGMRLAWLEAMREDYDYYLWLNDDTRLYPHALTTLLKLERAIETKAGRPAIVTGATCHPTSLETTYGGVMRESRWKPMSFLMVIPNGKPQQCDTIHGNCVLVPREIALRLGNLSDAYTHGIGDFDYGLRAQKAGYACWLTSEHVGTCARRALSGSMHDPALPVEERIEKMHRPTGLPPAEEWMHFTRHHAGCLWPVYWARTWVRMFCPRLWVLLRTHHEPAPARTG